MASLEVNNATAAPDASAGTTEGDSGSIAPINGLHDSTAASSTHEFVSDASEYPVSSLLDLKQNKPQVFRRLNFSKVSEHALTVVFPKIQQDLSPPMEFRVSAATVEAWCKMTAEAQCDYLAKGQTDSAERPKRLEQPESSSASNRPAKKPKSYFPLAPALSQGIPFLEERLEEVELYYSQVPPDFTDWTSFAAVAEAFPCKRGCGKRQMPLCLILDAKTDQDKLTVVNWWRSLSKEEQIKEFAEMKKMYASPKVSNRLLPADFYEKLNKTYKPPVNPVPVDPTGNDFYVNGPDRKKAPVDKDTSCRGWRGERYECIFHKCYVEAVKDLATKGDIAMEGGAKPFESIAIPESFSQSKGIGDLVFFREGDDYVLRSVGCTHVRASNTARFCPSCQQLCQTVGNLRAWCSKSKDDKAEKQQQLIKTLRHDLKKALRRERRVRDKLTEARNKLNEQYDGTASSDEEPSPQRQQILMQDSPTRRLPTTMQQHYIFEQGDPRNYWTYN